MPDVTTMIDPAEVRVVGECLRAAVDGPFFPDWEFHTLMGLNRPDMRAVHDDWPVQTTDDDSFVLAVRGAINNLIYYQHGYRDDTVWKFYISVDAREVYRIILKLIDNGFDFPEEPEHKDYHPGGPGILGLPKADPPPDPPPPPEPLPSPPPGPMTIDVTTLLDPAETGIVRTCLRAAAEGPFFPDAGFLSQMGIDRRGMRTILEAWPVQTLPDPVFARALLAALTGLLVLPEGYGGGPWVWSFYIPSTRAEVAAILRKLTDAGLTDRRPSPHP